MNQISIFCNSYKKSVLVPQYNPHSIYTLAKSDEGSSIAKLEFYFTRYDFGWFSKTLRFSWSHLLVCA